MKRKAKAFTIVEVLVIVAIMALLISILIPSLKRAKEMAKKKAAEQEIKQVEAAVEAADDGLVIRVELRKDDIRRIRIIYEGAEQAYPQIHGTIWLEHIMVMTWISMRTGNVSITIRADWVP